MDSKGATTVLYEEASSPLKERISVFAIHGLHERLLDGIDKELGCVCFRCCTSFETGHDMKKDNSSRFPIW